MIYATMCIGSDWCNQYRDSINNFALSNEVHILTDNPTHFSNCNTYSYKRNIFSYYEKINHILELSSLFKKRITYVDADWLSLTDTNLIFDNDSIYCYKHYSLDDNDIKKVFESDIKEKIKPIFSKIGLNDVGNNYIPEAFISLPYFKNIEEIKKDISSMQSPIEELFIKTAPSDRTQKYYEDGKVGMAEGWSLTAISLKYNINVKSISWRRIGLI